MHRRWSSCNFIVMHTVGEMVKHALVLTRTEAVRDMQYVGQVEVVLARAVTVFLKVVISCGYNFFWEGQ